MISPLSVPEKLGSPLHLFIWTVWFPHHFSIFSPKKKHQKQLRNCPLGSTAPIPSRIPSRLGLGAPSQGWCQAGCLTAGHWGLGGLRHSRNGWLTPKKFTWWGWGFRFCRENLGRYDLPDEKYEKWWIFPDLSDSLPAGKWVVETISGHGWFMTLFYPLHWNGDPDNRGGFAAIFAVNGWVPLSACWCAQLLIHTAPCLWGT